MKIGYKKARNDLIVKLEILGVNNEERKDIVDKNFAKMRCSEARVLAIYHMFTKKQQKYAFSIHDSNFKYTSHEIVKPMAADKGSYYRDINEVCASGIHYFLSEDAAILYGLFDLNGLPTNYPEKYSGMVSIYFDNGHMAERKHYQNGKLHAIYTYLP